MLSFNLSRLVPGGLCDDCDEDGGVTLAAVPTLLRSHRASPESPLAIRGSRLSGVFNLQDYRPQRPLNRQNRSLRNGRNTPQAEPLRILHGRPFRSHAKKDSALSQFVTLCGRIHAAIDPPWGEPLA